MLNMFSLLEDIAKRSIEAHPKKDGDYFDKDGLLICGVCNEKKWDFQYFANPTEENPDLKTRVKVGIACKCLRDEQERKKKEEERERDMRYIETLKSSSLMDERFREAKFDTYQATKYNEKNLKLCKRYATAFDEMLKKSQGLLFWGDVGTGKSFSAACIANYLLERKIPVVMTSFVKILEVIAKDQGYETEFLEKISHAKLVIFDDLGTERKTDYALEKVYNVVDSRYRSKLPMIFTTNLTLKQMQDEADLRFSRIYDRIFETCYPMQFTGPSMRKTMAFGRFDEMKSFLEGDD